MRFFFKLVPFLALVLQTHAHGVLTTVTGANGVSGQGFGVIASTPRTGTTRNPFQQDTSIIRDKEVTNGDAGVCGRTLAGGSNDVATQLAAAVTSGLPSAAADGSVSMTLHQVNGDGAGPYTCDVSTDGTGAAFTAMTVTTNVPGKNSRSNAKATDFALVAQMPAGTTCTGGANGDACLVRCRNAANAGPFGGCVAVTNAGNASATADASDTTGDSSLNATAADAGETISDSTSADSLATAVQTAEASATDSPDATVASADSLSTAVQTAEASEADSSADSPAASVQTAEASEAESPADSPAASPAATAAGASSVVASTGSSKKAKGNSAVSKLGLKRSRFAQAVRSDETDANDDSIHAAELALAADLERRVEQRIKRSRLAQATRSDETDANDDSIHDAELALAADLERRVEQRIKRSRIVGSRTLNIE